MEINGKRADYIDIMPLTKLSPLEISIIKEAGNTAIANGANNISNFSGEIIDIDVVGAAIVDSCGVINTINSGYHWKLFAESEYLQNHQAFFLFKIKDQKINKLAQSFPELFAIKNNQGKYESVFELAHHFCEGIQNGLNLITQTSSQLTHKLKNIHDLYFPDLPEKLLRFKSNIYMKDTRIGFEVSFYMSAELISHLLDSFNSFYSTEKH